MSDLSAFNLNETMVFVIEIAVAAAIGILIGLEREHSRADDRGRVVIAGVRTFPLLSMSGAVISFLSIKLSMPYLIPVGLAIFGVFSTVFFYARYHQEMKGVTTSLALFVTFLIGILVGLEMIFFGLVIGIVTTFLLASKHRLHDIAQIFSEDELLGALEFATLALIMLPLVYNLSFPAPWGDYIGRGKPLDIFWILLIVTIVSLISLMSFLAIRRFGSLKGLEFSGAMGGLINSEAAAASLAGIAKRSKGAESPALMGIMLSNATMLIRNLAICALADPSMSVLRIIALPCLSMTLCCLLFTRLFKGGCDGNEKIQMQNPFAILPALKFALLFTVIAGIAYVATSFRGMLGPSSAGDLAIGFTAIGAVVSSGAVVAPLSSLAFSGHITALLAGTVAVIACVVSTLNKIVLARLVCKDLTRKLIVPCLTTAIAGVATLALALLFLY